MLIVDYEHFERWLQGQQYRASTIHHTLLDTERIERALAAGDDPEELPASLRWTAQRIQRYGEATGGVQWTTGSEAFVQTLAQRKLGKRGGGGRRARRRKHVARSFSDADWKRLCSVIAADHSIEGRVLDIMLATGLRIGDVLRISRVALDRGIRAGVIELEQKGGAERFIPVPGAADEWMALVRAWKGQQGGVVAALVCPGNPSSRAGDCAYQRVRRHLLKLGGDLDVEGRLNSHRIRRTVGVQALRAGGDVPAVQELLGHANPMSTLGYLDESRPERVADLQQQIRRRYRDDEPDDDPT